MKQSELNPTPIRVRSAEIPGYRLLYGLYETPMKSGERSYSVTVAITDGRECMAASAPDLTRSKEEAHRLFSLLSAGTVTPCALADVLEELL